jgi:hypothetical protein
LQADSAAYKAPYLLNGGDALFLLWSAPLILKVFGFVAAAFNASFGTFWPDSKQIERK